MVLPISVSFTSQSRVTLHAPQGCVQEQPRSLARLTAIAVGAPSPVGTPAAHGGPVAGCSPAAVHAMVSVLPAAREVLGMLSSLQGRAKLSSSCKQSFSCAPRWESCFERLGFRASHPWRCSGTSLAQSS